jgi:hypothetical protein
MGDIKEADVREALERPDPLWNELFTVAEQARIVHLLVERVDVSQDGVEIRLRTEGLANLVADLRAVKPEPPEGDVSESAVAGNSSSHPTAHLMQGRCSWLFRLIFLSLIGTESQKFALNFVPDSPCGGSAGG